MDALVSKYLHWLRTTMAEPTMGQISLKWSWWHPLCSHPQANVWLPVRYSVLSIPFQHFTIQCHYRDGEPNLNSGKNNVDDNIRNNRSDTANYSKIRTDWKQDNSMHSFKQQWFYCGNIPNKFLYIFDRNYLLKSRLLLLHPKLVPRFPRLE